MNTDNFQLFEQAFDKKFADLQNVSLVQENSIKFLLQNKTECTFNKFLFNKLFMCLFSGIVLFYLSSNYSLYLNEIKYLIPFIALEILFLSSFMWYIWVLYLVMRSNRLQQPIVEVELYSQKLKSAEKIELISSFAIALPILIICLPPITSLTFDRLDFYSHITDYLPAMIIGIVISIVLGIYLYKQNIKLLNQISDYKKIINNEYIDQEKDN